jgi:hypothetical protein
VTGPPLGPKRPSADQTCGRLIGDGHCGAPAVEHIAWTADLENGLVCVEHRAEAEREWVFYDRHAVHASPPCQACKFGHPYDEANTRITAGKRYCRVCNRAAQMRAHRKRVAAGGSASHRR